MATTDTEWAAVRKAPDRDRYGRYLIPDLITGKPVGYTRVTTLTGALDDRHNLELWKLRTATAGFVARPDLFALAHAQLGDKKQLDRTIDTALDAGKGNEGSNLGTALHALTEALDLGQEVPTPAPYDQDIAAYLKAMKRSKLTVLREHVEQILVIDGQPERIAGTCDRILRAPSKGLLIADLKTGQNLDYGWTGIAMQLACYAHATATFDPVTGERGPVPEGIDQGHALVMHLPAGQATCTLHYVDIAAGWAAVQLAFRVREWRKTRGLATPYTVTVPADSGLRRTLEQRIRVIAQYGAIDRLAARWPAGIPTFKQSDAHTAEQLAEIATVIGHVEADAEIPF